MMPEDDQPYVRIFQSEEQTDLDLVKGFLKAQGIPFTTTGDSSADFGMTHWNRMPTFDEPAGRQLFVHPRYVKQATRALADVNRRRQRSTESRQTPEQAEYYRQAAWLFVVGMVIVILWNVIQIIRR